MLLSEMRAGFPKGQSLANCLNKVFLSLKHPKFIIKLITLKEPTAKLDLELTAGSNWDKALLERRGTCLMRCWGHLCRPRHGVEVPKWA